MRLNRYKIATATACALVAANTSWGAATAQHLPYVENFEDALTEANGWSQGDVGGAITIQVADHVQGTYAVTADMANPQLNITGTPTYQNVWCRMAAKPTLYDDSALPPSKPDSTVTVAFYVDADGNVKRPPTTNGDPWVTIGTLTDPVEWCTFVVHTDYVNEKWDLYVSQGVNYLQACTRLNADPIPFNDATPSSLTQVEVQGITTLDAMALTKDRTQVVDANSNGDYVKVSVVHVPLAGPYYECGIYGSAYPANENKVNTLNALGLDMLEWMATDDEVQVWSAANNNTKWATHAGSSWTDGNNGTSVLITDGTGVQLKKTSPGWFVGFFDYDTLTEASQQVNIEGAKYWNLLAWGKDTASGQLGSGTHLGIAGARFDNLYLIRNNIVYAFAWSVTLNTWVNTQGQLATDIIQPGETFWVYRFNNTTPWDLRTAQ